MTDKVAGPDGSALSEGLGPKVADAWRRHAQRVHYQWPMGCGGHAALQTPEIMAELGFTEAVRELLTAERERWRDAVEALAHSWDDPAEAYGMRLALKEGLRA